MKTFGEFKHPFNQDIYIKYDKNWVIENTRGCANI